MKSPERDGKKDMMEKFTVAKMANGRMVYLGNDNHPAISEQIAKDHISAGCYFVSNICLAKTFDKMEDAKRMIFGKGEFVLTIG